MAANEFVESLAAGLDAHPEIVGIRVGRTAYGLMASKPGRSAVVARCHRTDAGTHVTLTFTCTAATAGSTSDVVAAALTAAAAECSRRADAG
jgi:hypothetical protein